MTKKMEIVQQVEKNLIGNIDIDNGGFPPNFKKARFIQNCLAVISDLRDVNNLNPESITKTMMKGAYLGLDFFNKECYAIPYKGNLSFQTDYKGEIKIAKNFSIKPIKDIYAKLVKEGHDYKEIISNGLPSIDFNPKPFNDGEIKGVFAVCLFEDGTMKYDSMSAKDVEEVRRNYSKQPDGSVWKKSKGEMYKKTVLRRLCKMIELDFDSINGAKAYEEGSQMDFNKKIEYIEAKPVEVKKIELQNETQNTEVALDEGDYKELVLQKIKKDFLFGDKTIEAFLDFKLPKFQHLYENNDDFENIITIFLQEYISKNKDALSKYLGDQTQSLESLPEDFKGITDLYKYIVKQSQNRS